MLDIEVIPQDRTVTIKVSNPGFVKSIIHGIGHTTFEISGLSQNDTQIMLQATYASNEKSLSELIHLSRLAVALQKRLGVDGISIITEVLQLDETDATVVRNLALVELWPEAFKK